ncbi:MAG TPA: class I SAM-dependent methyltransferase, partial [Candidatus Binatia bacterium]|nr:class I SAM-dependent methyltransferase [Candidatus Binatia bacterium]
TGSIPVSRSRRMEEYKLENLKAYETYTELFDQKFGEHFYNAGVVDRADEFIKNLKGKSIVDLGSGPGNHAEYFKNKGLDVLCVDISGKMLEQCQRKGLKTLQMDIEELNLPGKYDGIWAYASLLHVKKEKAQSIFNKIWESLNPDGVLSLAVKEGVGGQYETNYKYPDTKRWFTYYTDDEIKQLIEGKFQILNNHRAELKSSVFISYLLKKIND